MAVRGETEVLTFKANMDQLHQQLAKLPGVTDKEAKKMVRSLERQLKRTETAAARAAKSSGRSMGEMERSMRHTQRRVQKLGAAASAISPAFGSMVTSAGAVAGGLSALMTPTGVVIGGMVALTAAVAGTSAGMLIAVRKSRDLHAELKKLDHIDGILPPVTRQQLASLESANAAIDGLGVVARSAMLTLGTEFAPAVEKAAVVTLKFGLMAIDAFQAFAEGHDVLKEIAVFMGKTLVQSMVLPISSLANMIEMLGDLASAVGAEGLGASLSAFGDKWDTFTESISRAGVDLVFDATGASLDYLGEMTGDYDARAQKLIGTMTELHRATKSAEVATVDYSDALRAVAMAGKFAARDSEAATARILDLRDAASSLTSPNLTRLEELQALLVSMTAEASRSTVANLALADSIASVSAAIGEEQIKQVKEQRQAQVENLQGYLGYAQQGFSMLSSGYETSADMAANMVTHLTSQMAAGESFYTAEQKAQLQKRIEQQKRAAREAFEAVKAAKIAEAASSTALGVINAISQNPFPSPLGLIGAGIVAAAGAKSIGEISKQRVTFHNAAPPDEIPATVLRSERLVNSAGRQTLGDEVIRRANAGAGGGGQVLRVLNTYQHRIFNRFIKDGLTMGNPISEAVSAGSTPGHRANRKGI
jgi:transcriptional regulator of heat shock response